MFPITDMDRPLGLQELEAPRISRHWHMAENNTVLLGTIRRKRIHCVTRYGFSYCYSRWCLKVWLYLYT